MPSTISIKIIYALYGIQEHTVDVTNEAQAALAGDDLTISARRLGIDDPAPGEMKYFAVKAEVRIDNEDPTTYQYIAKDYETIDFVP